MGSDTRGLTVTALELLLFYVVLDPFEFSDEFDSDLFESDSALALAFRRTSALCSVNLSSSATDSVGNPSVSFLSSFPDLYFSVSVMLSAY